MWIFRYDESKRKKKIYKKFEKEKKEVGKLL